MGTIISLYLASRENDLVPLSHRPMFFGSELSTHQSYWCGTFAKGLVIQSVATLEISRILQGNMALSPEAFVIRWAASGGSARVNCALFLSELRNLIDVPRPDVATAVGQGTVRYLRPEYQNRPTRGCWSRPRLSRVPRPSYLPSHGNWPNSLR